MPLPNFLTNILSFSSPLQQISTFLRLIAVLFYGIYTLIDLQIDQIERLSSMSTYQIVQYISVNLATPPISNLIVIPSIQTCPMNYDVINLAYWGSVQSSQVQNVSQQLSSEYTNSIFSIRQHNIFESSLKRKNLSLNKGKRLEQIPLCVWKSEKFCVRRLKEFVYIHQKDLCPQSYMLCSSNLCISNKEQCPITEVSVHNIQHDKVIEEMENKSAERDLFLEIDRDTLKSPLYTLELSVMPYACYRKNFSLNETTLYAKLKCDVYGEDRDVEVLDNQVFSVFLQENKISVQNITTNQNYENFMNSATNNSNNILAEVFLVGRKRLNRKEETENIHFDEFMNKFTKTENIKVVLTAFINIEAIIFFLLFCLEYKILAILLASYFLLQTFIGLYLSYLIQITTEIRDYNYYISLNDAELISKPELQMALNEMKSSVENIINSLMFAAVAILLLELLRLAVFGIFIKKHWGIWNERSRGENNAELRLETNIETMGVLLGLYPGLDTEMVSRGQRRYERRTRSQRIELRPISSGDSEQA